MQSFWKRQSCVLAAVLAIGSGGALMGGGPGALSDTFSSVTAIDNLSGSFTSLEAKSDGTAQAFVFTSLSPTVILGVAFYPPTDYAILADIQPGQSGQGGGYGTASFEMDGVFAIDLLTFLPVGPLDVTVDIEVADPTAVSALASQGITAQFDILTGETSVVREHRNGNQAYGDTAGSLSIYVDFMDGGGFVPVADATGQFGMVTVTNVHLVEQIH